MIISFIYFLMSLFILRAFLLPYPHLLGLGLLLTILFILFFSRFYSWETNSYLFTLWLMSLFLSLYDYLYFIVEPILFYSLSLITLYLYFTQHSFSYYNLIQPTGIFLFFLILAYFLPDSFGGGDVKLLMIYGIILSFQQLLLLIMLASLLGIVFILLFFLHQKKTLIKIPFVPFLTISLLIISFLYIR